MQRDERVVRMLVLAVLAGLLVGMIAAWAGIQPETQAQLNAQRVLLEQPNWIRIEDVTDNRSWFAANPIIAGAGTAVLVFVLGVAAGERHRA